MIACAGAFAQNFQPAADQLPPLRPPAGELPLSFWELHSVAIVLGSLALLILLGAAIWFLTRPKPPVIIPPGVTARQTLEGLRQQPENGVLLSRVSQALRRYVGAAFGLPAGELTTTEFCRTIEAQEQVGPDLAKALGGFLRQCDELKFAPAPPSPPFGAVPRGLELVQMAEARLAEARNEAQTTSGGSANP